MKSSVAKLGYGVAVLIAASYAFVTLRGALKLDGPMPTDGEGIPGSCAEIEIACHL